MRRFLLFLLPLTEQCLRAVITHRPRVHAKEEREKAVDGARESALHSLWVVASTDDTREDEEEDEKTSRYRAVERTACGKNQSDELVVVVVVVV